VASKRRNTLVPIINALTLLLHFAELFHTERSHVRTLKVLDRLFYRPLLEQQQLLQSPALPRDFVERLFPNLEEVLAWHSKANQRMRDRVKSEGFPIGHIGDILSDMVRQEAIKKFPSWA